MNQNPDGGGRLTAEQEDARREYLIALRNLWEKQHNLALSLATSLAQVGITPSIFKVVGIVARPITSSISEKLHNSSGAIADFARSALGRVSSAARVRYRYYNPKIDLDNIPRPKSSNAINSERASAWIDAHPTVSGQAVARALVKEIQRISQDRFEEDLRKVIVKLTASIPAGEDIIVVSETNKSNMWVSRLALANLNKKPKAVYNLPFIGHEKVPNYITEFIPVSDRGVRRFIFFDDAIYSGNQLSNNIRGFVDLLRKSGIDPSAVNIDVVVPYATKSGRELVQNATNDAQVNVFIQEIIDTAEDKMAKYGQDVLEEYRAMYNALPQTALTYFDHKMPDATSVLTRVMKEGYVMSKEKGEDGRYMYFSRQVIEQIPFIPDITPPYK